MEISKKDWESYRFVQKSGEYNMFDPRARLMTHLTKDKWVDIIKNYNELKTQYETKEV
jgi:hypothetical protein